MLRIVGKYASTSKAHDSLWLAIASALARFGAQHGHAAAVAAIRTYVDNALVRDYQEMKRKKVRPETYVEVNIDRLALLADRSDWMAIVRIVPLGGISKNSLCTEPGTVKAVMITARCNNRTFSPFLLQLPPHLVEIHRFRVVGPHTTCDDVDGWDLVEELRDVSFDCCKCADSQGN